MLGEIYRVSFIGHRRVDDFYFVENQLDNTQKALERAQQIIDDGGDIIDVGAYSSRPGADDVSEEEEIARLRSVLPIIREKYPDAIISVDTFRSRVARYAVEECGVDIINDIMGGDGDEEMFSTIAQLKVPYIAMHMRGTPATMSEMIQYDNVVADVMRELSQRINEFTLAGINDIIIDPGFGFAKTTEQNYELLQNLELFHELGYPLLVGVSRKSMIYRALGVTPDDALNGTTVVNTIALQVGASILRVHDVKQAVEAVKIMMLTNKQ